jgi:hypothetical protein
VNNRLEAEARSLAVRQAIKDHAASGGKRMSIVSAAPGSGKSTALLQVADQLLSMDGIQRVIIAAQTNNQANALGIKFAEKFGAERVYRFASTLIKKPADYTGHWKHSVKDIQDKTDCVVIATAAKWGQAIASTPDFSGDYLLVDEAFQMPYSTYVQISCLSENFILIGDEGQIPPVVPIDASRWDSSNYPPHWPAPVTLDATMKTHGDKFLREGLEYCWRLPHGSVNYIKPFYARLGVDVKAVPAPEDRTLEFKNPLSSSNPSIIEALTKMADGSPVLVTVPDDVAGVPLDADQSVANAVKETLRTLIQSQSVYSKLEDPSQKQIGTLKLSDIAICSSKRAMNALIENSIQEVLAEAPESVIDQELKSTPNMGLRVDTPERLQGLEFKVFFAVHPLSNAEKPSSFDLETGRLCVMASRHEIGLIFFSREHILNTLDLELPNANQAPGLDDVTGLGHRLHRGFISMLKENNRVVRVTN